MPGLYELYRDRLSDLEIYEQDDRYKEAKQQEVRCWYEDYCKLLYGTFTKEGAEKLKEIFKDSAIWIKVSNFGDAGDIRLDRAALGRRLIDLKYENGNHLFTQVICYNIACRCGFEEEARNIFDSLLSADEPSIRKELARFRYLISDNPSREALIERFQKHDKLVAFWSYWIHKDIPEVSDKLKSLIGLDNSESLEENRQRLYEYGIKDAEGYRYLESLEFFWERLPEKKGELLLEAVLNSASANINSWGLRNLEASRQREFSIKSLEGGRHFFWTLTKNYFWQDIKMVFSFLKPSDISISNYKSRFSSISESVVKSPELLRRKGIDLLSYLWKLDGFDKHRQHYLNRINIDSYFGKLLEIGETEIVFCMLNMTNKEQFIKFIGYHGTLAMYSNLKDSGKTDYLMMLFYFFKKKDSFAVEEFLKENDPDNLENIMNYVPNSSNPYSYLAQNFSMLDANSQLEGVSDNINLVSNKPVNFYERTLCHYPLL